jgi:Ca2+-binding EF-hand superfamily protein
MPIIDALDLNHDRIIDAAELAKASESLRKLDKNGDGQLSAEEFRPAPGRGMGPPPE